MHFFMISSPFYFRVFVCRTLYQSNINSMGKNQITDNFNENADHLKKTHNKFTYFIGIFHAEPYGFVCDIAVRLRAEY